MISKPSIIDIPFLSGHVNSLKELLEGGLGCLAENPVGGPEEIPAGGPEEVFAGDLKEVLLGGPRGRP